MSSGVSEQLCIYLGSAATGSNGSHAGFATLSDAVAKLGGSSSNNNVHSLSITVSGKDDPEAVWSNPMELTNLVMACLDSDKSVVTLTVLLSEGDAANNKWKKTWSSSLMLAGLEGVYESSGNAGQMIWKAQKKITNHGAPVALKKNKNTNTNAVVTLDINNDNEENMLIDEDALLDDELDAPDMKGVTQAGDNKDDCGGREPCDDCTCGRASGSTEHNNAKKEIKTSSCGKCGLGDAFRCASCPYLGKPAFKPGEEHLVLDLKDDF